MVVNSVSFWIFFGSVFVIYYFLARRDRPRWQNSWLLLAGYFFYGYAEWRMIPLLLAATVVFYVLGIAIGRYNSTHEKKASLLTTLGTVFGVGILLYFKYLNFFIESFAGLLEAIGFSVHVKTLQILMPLGISFFTFKLISYLIEVHRGHMDPCRDFVTFATYISFFPTILSGPIDRPQPFVSQLEKKRTFDYQMAMLGLKRIAWGLFLKMCIADRLSIYIDAVFNNAGYHNGTSLAFASLLYPVQIYADFCGYSDMAIGVGALLGLKVAENFRRPFFSQNIAEYWRRWHMSLTSWLTDYVFMPLNVRFRNMERGGSILAIIITFVLIGFWHGANWTFVLFGLYHGLLYIPLMLSGRFFKKSKLKKTNSGWPTLQSCLKMAWTYLLVAVGLILFRAASVEQAGVVFAGLAGAWGTLFLDNSTLVNAFCCMLVLFYTDFKNEFFPAQDKGGGFFHRYTYELVISFYILLVLFFGVFDGNQFIYFQF